MGLRVGLVAGILIYKKAKGYMTRLERLIKKEKSKPSRQIQLCQIPSKLIFSILMIIFMVFGCEYFIYKVKEEIVSQWGISETQINQNLVSPLNSLNRTGFEQIEYIDFEQSKVQIIITNSWNSIDIQSQQQLKSLTSFVFLIQFSSAIGILILVFQLKIKWIKVECAKKQILMETRSLLASTKQSLKVDQEHMIIIKEEGQSRFTNTNYYFVVELVTKGNQDGINSIELIRRSCIFEARKAAIQIGTILKMEYRTKIYKNHNMKKSQKDFDS